MNKKIELSDSQGVTIEMLREAFKLQGTPLPSRRVARVIAPECGDSRVQPQHAPSCGIKAIMERHRALGINPVRPLDPDVCGQAVRYTYAEAFAMVEHAHEQFMTLPAAVRDKFANDPAAIMDFVMDEGNREEAIKLGLLVKPAPAPLSAKDIADAVKEGFGPQKLVEKSTQTS